MVVLHNLEINTNTKVMFKYYNIKYFNFFYCIFSFFTYLLSVGKKNNSV